MEHASEQNDLAWVEALAAEADAVVAVKASRGARPVRRVLCVFHLHSRHWDWIGLNSYCQTCGRKMR